MDCLFCQIGKKQIPSRIVYEDNDLLAFEDLHPQAPVHLLVIPKMHLATLNDLTSEHVALVGKLLLAARELARERGVEKEGYRVVINCNSGAGQTVFHLHAHLLGGRELGWPPG
jgi:histidine triad (HIT) family protein